MFGKFSLVEILLFLKECKLFIGNDSGLMHLAASLELELLVCLDQVVWKNIVLGVEKHSIFLVKRVQRN